MAIELIRKRPGRAAARLATVAAMLAASACVSVDRPGAQALGKAGTDAYGALSTELTGVGERITRGIAFNTFAAAYGVMKDCGTPAEPPITADGRPSDCDIVHQGRELRRREVVGAYTRIRARIKARARAADALNQAYAAFSAEAAYDQREDLVPALREAGGAINDFAALVGVSPISGLVLELVAQAGGLFADAAQRSRLVRGSIALQTLTQKLREALVKERENYDLLELSLAEDRNQVRDHLIDTTSTGPLLNAQLAGSGLPALSDAGAQAAVTAAPSLRAALQASSLAQPSGSSNANLDAIIEVLNALDRQHSQFQAGRPVSLADITIAIDRLTAIVAAMRADEEADQ